MIRRATADDRSKLLELIAEFYEIDGHPFDPVGVAAALDPLLVSDDHGVVLIGDDGYAVVTWSYSLESGGRDALLDELYVRQRGLGTGSALMDAVFSDVRGRGMRRIFLETESANSAARSFYERHGFEAEDSVWMSIDIG